MDDAFIADQAAGFVAKYDANGVLKAVQSFVPKALPELEATGMYYPLAGDFRFDISTLAYGNGKLYVAATYTGLTENNNFSSSQYKQEPPEVCPGVCITLNSRFPKCIKSPSSTLEST